MVLSKLSKLLNQEDALSAPWLRGDLHSPQPPVAGRRKSADGVSVIFDVTYPLAIPKSSRRQAVMLSRVVGGECTGSVDRRIAKQDRHA
jgi:hypothetical protein